MKNTTRKARTIARASRPGISAGPDGLAISPPDYGVDSFDPGLALQRKADNRLLTPRRTGLPDELKTGIEGLSGFSLEDVRVHYNSSQPAQLQALAYAQGADIHLGPGQERHLPHEAWHVVQQKQGRVQSTVQNKGVPINDSQALEQEADYMGRKATSARFCPQPYQAVSQHRAPESVVQRQVIKSVGIELELKGASLFKGDDAGEKEKRIQYGLHEKVIDRGDWWIEADEQNPELVTEPTKHRNEFFSWLEEGHETLKNIQILAEKIALYDPKNGDEQLRGEILRLMSDTGIPPEAALTMRSEDKYLAKPQISFGINAGKLSKFAKKITGPKIQYTEGYNKNGEKYENEEWPRVNEEVQNIFHSSPAWANEKGQAFRGKIDSVSKEARGLSLMTIITILFAARKQNPDNREEYYKARFSVLPRVPLTELYDVLREEKQDEYRELMQLWLESIKLHNQDKEETSSDYYRTKIENATHADSVEIEDEVKSIIDFTERHPKSLEFGPKDVDLISSDKVANTGNVGASVGAYDLPYNSDGIYEIRSMPYINIEDYAKVAKIYDETIKAYGDMA